MTGVDEALRDRPRGIGPAIPRLLGDERLARLAAAGDERAFAAIYRRYGEDLQRYCQAIIGNPHDAADAVQNTMVSALRALPGEARDVALKPWLYRVAHNESISLLRRRRPGVELDPDQLTVPAADTDAETTERLRQLVSDLGQLADRQRSALVLRELSGLSFAEIGASLGCSAAAARQLVYETRLALQEMADGREMDCEHARRAISERDGRILRGRRLRAHLHACERCADFRAGIADRRQDLAQLAPPLALPGVLGLIKGLGLGGGGAAGSAGAGAGAAAGASVAAKSATAVLAAAAIGTGAAQVSGVVDLPGLGDGGAAAERVGASPPAADRPAAAGAATGAPGVDGADGGRGAAIGSAKRRSGAPGERDGTSAGRADRRRGRGHAPPSQAGTPPREGQTAPGQAQTPPRPGPAPGQIKAPPGQENVPPGQLSNPPGQLETPPGRTASPPGQAGTAPDQGQPRPEPAGAPKGGASAGSTRNGAGPPAHAQPRSRP
jgi:RNA polymerase sigma factor (sigma-70 family)